MSASVGDPRFGKLYPCVCRTQATEQRNLEDLYRLSNLDAFQSKIFASFDPEVPGYGPNKPNPPTGGFGNILLEAAEFTVWGTNDATEVFPFVPVTATTISGWAPAKRAAIWANSWRGLSERISVALPGSFAASPAMIATAPAAIACGMKCAPSMLVPGSAAKR